MLRALFEKTGSAVYISHLDLMRMLQRAFQRAGLSLTHTHGFNARPSVSIALPLSLGIESKCELLDFNLEGEIPPMEEIASRLNDALIDGVRIRRVYPDGQKLKNLSLLQSLVTLEYDSGVPENAREEIASLFARKELLVEKKNKNGNTEQDLIPMIRRLSVTQLSRQELQLELLCCCQNPTLNPMQLAAAINKYLPECKPDFVRCQRIELYDTNETLFR